MLATVIGRWVLAAVVLLGPAVSYADDDCVRIGVEVWRSISLDRDSDMISVVGERALGPVGLRGRITHGFLGESGNGLYPPGAPYGDVDLWSATLGVESRGAMSRGGGIAGFAGIGLGAMRLSNGWLGDGTEIRGHVLLQLGLDLRTGWLRTRPAIGLSLTLAENDPYSRLRSLTGIGIGFEFAR